MKHTWAIALSLLFLAGCATTKGKDTAVKTEIVLRDNYNCQITISPAIDQESLTGDIKDLKADNAQDIPVELAIPSPLPTTVEGAKALIKSNTEKDIIGSIIESVTPAPTEVLGGTNHVKSALKNGAYPPGYDWVHSFTTTELKDNHPVWRLDKRFCIAETSSQAMFDNTPLLNGQTENFDGQLFIPHSNESVDEGAIWDSEACVLTGWNLSLGAWSNKPGKTLYLSTQGNPLK